MDIPIEDRNLSLFCLLDILFTRGHHGLPDFPSDSWINSASEWDYIQYLCPLYPTEHEGWVDPPVNCGCLTVEPKYRREVFNRVFSYKNNEGRITWVNLHGDPHFFMPENPKEVPTLKMLSGYAVRQQLICMLNRQRRASYHYKEFQAIQKDLCETYGLLYELSIWVLPSLNYPTAWIRDKDSPSPYLKFGEIPWSGLERHGYHSRLIQPDLFHCEFEIWSFLFELQTSNRHPYLLPDLSFKTDEEREVRNHETLFHYDPIKSYGTRARLIYNALNVHWRDGDL